MSIRLQLITRLLSARTPALLIRQELTNVMILSRVYIQLEVSVTHHHLQFGKRDIS
jgi:hypothetical protein